VNVNDFWGRARHAAACIIDGRTHGRELDGAFENYDGDDMCAALLKIADAKPELADALPRVMGASFFKAGHTLKHLSKRELAKRAQKSRECRGYTFS